MIIKADSPEGYVQQIPAERVAAFSRLRQCMLTHLPPGFEEGIHYGMIGYVVPKHLYPSGYHVDPSEPLPFISIASQKNHVALYHMGLYTDKTLLEWFVNTYPQFSTTKLDMGKSCIRFKNVHVIPFTLIEELVSRMTVEQWIAIYESTLKK